MTSTTTELRRLRGAYRTVAASDAGRLVIADLLRQCGVNREVFTPGAADVTAYRAGVRKVGLYIVAQLELTERDAMRTEVQAHGRRDDAYID